MVLVYTQHVVGLDVSYVIRGDHHSSTNLSLDADVHLHRARRFVVGIEHRVARREETVRRGGTAIREVLTHIGRIIVLEVQRRSRLVGLLQRDDRRQRITDEWKAGRTSWPADRVSKRTSGSVNGAIRRLQGHWRPGSSTRREVLQEGPGLLSKRTVKEHVIPDGVLVEKTDATTDRSLPVF